MARKRDYAAEYARRIARANAKGYSKAVARGHTPKGVISLKRSKQLKGRLPPGFVIIRKNPRRGFRATQNTRAKNLREVGIREFLSDVTTNEGEFIRLLTQSGFNEREAYTLWFS